MRLIKISVGVQVGSNTLILNAGTSTPSRQAGDAKAQGVGRAYDFPSEGRQPPVIIQTITYCTDWNLHWITPNQRKRGQAIQHQLEQEGCLTDYHNYAEATFASAAEQAGQSLAYVFSW